MNEDVQAADEKPHAQEAVPAERTEAPGTSDTSHAALPAGADAPDSLTELVQPAAPRTGVSQEGPRISTVMGPLPARVPVQQTRDLNDAVHQILVVGLAVSTVLLVAGLVLTLAQGGSLPTRALALGPAIYAALALQPIGLLSLGLITLMLTPIVRVIGSVIVFTWERDWLYAGITLTVLVVMAVSVVIGRG